jgi:hypothetical protein
MTTKPPSGTGLAAVGSDEDATATDLEEGIETVLRDASGQTPKSLTLPAPGDPPASTETPLPISLETPPPVSAKTPAPALKTPGPTPAPLFGNGAASGGTGTPGPVITKTPAPLTKRDPTSLLPSIPPARKEPSGAFPLPGMAAPDAGKSSDDEQTLIARLSVLDDPGEESTKVEEVDAVLRATAKAEPIALSEQASAERERALSVSAADRVAAAEFEEPGDDDDEVVIATPGIISISDDDDDEEPTASQRPPGTPRKTPTPATGGPRLQTPIPLAASGPRLPAPTLPPGKSPRLPTPSGGLPPIAALLATPPSAPQRAITPALPIPAPVGTPATSSSPASAIFNKVQLPMGGLVAFLVAAFGAGFVLGAWLWGGGQPVASPVPAQAPAAAQATAVPQPAPASAPAAVAAPAPTAPAAAPEKPPAAAVEKPPAAEAKAAAPAAAEEKAPAIEEKQAAAVEKPPAAEAEAPPARRPPPLHPKPLVRKPPAPAAAKPAAPAAKPAVAAAKPSAKPAASEKPATKNDKAAAKAKAWVDPFAE